MGVPPQNQSSEETQGEYYYGTWYPTSGKDADVNESNDLSEGISIKSFKKKKKLKKKVSQTKSKWYRKFLEVAAGYVPGYGGFPYHAPAYATCAPFVAPYATYAPPYAQVKDH